ncbi:MAG TPA: hypothetical protein VFZ59_25535 [Verrucomicrobiae bacterium]|nr:hypothetical protein [Verrucomicrobiae bacterium]
MKSGTANAEVGAEAKEETCEGAATGSVQNTTVATRAEKSWDALAETGARGAGCELGADCETQHERLHVQQLRFGPEKFVGADAKA